LRPVSGFLTPEPLAGTILDTHLDSAAIAWGA